MINKKDIEAIKDIVEDALWKDTKEFSYGHIMGLFEKAIDKYYSQTHGEKN